MLNDDYREMLSLLSAVEAQYVLVGAYAMAAHGYPRATADLDIFVRADPQNAARVYEALRQFGAPMDRFSVEDLSRPDCVVQIGTAPRRLDIITSIDAVTFDEAWLGHCTVTIDSLPVPVISLGDLVRNKRATGREKDRLDADVLTQTRPA
jgi:hypothetical protein